MILALYIPNHLSKYLLVPETAAIGYSLFNNIGLAIFAYYVYLANKKDINYVKNCTWINLIMHTVFMYNFWEVRKAKVD
jgi:hypothetical protein